MKTFTRSFGLVAIFLCVEFVDELVDGTSPKMSPPPRSPKPFARFDKP
ncbi:hypothetical protein [Microvenator marinus]|nr:hypothetical protein [Microvenator marinus]